MQFMYLNCKVKENCPFKATLNAVLPYIDKIIVGKFYSFLVCFRLFREEAGKWALKMDQFR